MFRRVFIAGVLLLAIGGIGALLIGKSYFFAAELEESTTNFADALIEEINVKGEMGSLSIESTTGDAVIVESHSSKKGEQIKTELNGHTLTVSTPKRRMIDFGINFNEKRTNIIIHLPEKSYKKISADNELGAIKITGIQAERIQCESEIGDITIKDSTGELNLKNELGDIKIEAQAIQHSITASNEIGNIKISVNERPEDHTISASSEIGSIQTFGKKTRSYLSGNGSIAVDLKTEIGNIDLDS